MFGLNPVLNPSGCGTVAGAATTAAAGGAWAGVKTGGGGCDATDALGAGAGAFGSGTNFGGGLAVPRDEKSGVGGVSHENIL